MLASHLSNKHADGCKALPTADHTWTLRPGRLRSLRPDPTSGLVRAAAEFSVTNTMANEKNAPKRWRVDTRKCRCDEKEVTFPACGKGVEFDPSRRSSTGGERRRPCVRFGMPCLEVRPSRHSLGSGSIFHWTGSSSFSDESGMQCRLNFGERRGEDEREKICWENDWEDVHGILRDADGSQVVRIHGSWLGPLLCDGEVLWKGPAAM
eukprot:s178_g8.t1